MKRIREVLIEETFKKVKGKVYWVYRFNGQGEWNYQLTHFKEIPWIKWQALKSDSTK